jgi:hypothetical protein
MDSVDKDNFDLFFGHPQAVNHFTHRGAPGDLKDRASFSGIRAIFGEGCVEFAVHLHECSPRECPEKPNPVKYKALSSLMYTQGVAAVSTDLEAPG